MIVLAVLLIVVIIYYINYRKSRKLLYKLSDTLPDAGELPIFGHTHWFLGGPERLLNNIKILAGKLKDAGDLTKMWIGPHLYIVPFNLDDVQKILENCLDKDSSYKFLQTWFGNGLFVAPVEIWKSHRRLLQPIFNNKLTEEYIDVFGKQGKVLVQRLEERVGKEPFDIYKYVTSCMLDILFETAMGEKMDLQNNSTDNPYVMARKKVMSIITMRIFKPWLQPDALFKLTTYSKIQKENIEYTHKFTDEVIQKKRLHIQSNNSTQNDGAKDILELLILKDGTLTNQQLREHINSITIAGSDTTSLVISYAILLLGCHEKEHEKVYKELNEVFGSSNRSPSRDDLSRLDYLERVIKETMRLYTVVPIIGRETHRELKLSSCTLPVGVGCAVMPFIIHRSKAIWGPDADEFNPDRFLPENSVNRHPCAYIPFSYGSRNCIGVAQTDTYLLGLPISESRTLVILEFMEYFPILDNSISETKEISIGIDIRSDIGSPSTHYIQYRLIYVQKIPCITLLIDSKGRHYSMLAMKIILASILRNYKISSEECNRLKFELLLFPVNGHLVSLEKRH